jgi:hypothetical protein
MHLNLCGPRRHLGLTAKPPVLSFLRLTPTHTLVARLAAGQRSRPELLNLASAESEKLGAPQPHSGHWLCKCNERSIVQNEPQKGSFIQPLPGARGLLWMLRGTVNTNQTPVPRSLLQWDSESRGGMQGSLARQPGHMQPKGACERHATIPLVKTG